MVTTDLAQFLLESSHFLAQGDDDVTQFVEGRFIAHESPRAYRTDRIEPGEPDRRARPGGRNRFVAHGKSPRSFVASAIRSTPTARAVSRKVTPSWPCRIQTASKASCMVVSSRWWKSSFSHM